MGRHSRSYRAAQQEFSTQASITSFTSAYVGRVGLLAVALGIGAAVAGGTAIASADTSSGNAADDRAAQSSAGNSAAESTKPKQRRAQNVASDADTRTDPHSRDDDPGSAPASSLAGVTGMATREGGTADPTADVAQQDRDGIVADDVVTIDDSAPDLSRQSLPTSTQPATSSASIVAAIDPEVPAPTDQTATEYGDIGKWMLQWNGEIADYGGLPYDGKTVLEPINVIIVDPTSRTALEGTWRLNAAMRRSGFPPRLIHSTGFRGLIDDQRYRQQPRGLLVGYSDDFFLVPNNHGRIFGPDPVETSSGYVWSGAFSKEELVVYQGLPRHAYVSANVARAALAAQLVASGRATLGGMVSLDNAYHTDTTTTGDHDGYAVVVILNGRGTVSAAANTEMLVGGQTTANRACLGGGDLGASPATSRCATVTVAASGHLRRHE